MENSYLEIQSNVGINCRKSNCMVIHPSELHMIYAVGALLVVKTVDSENDQFYKGHYSLITNVTCSNNGSLICSGEAYEPQSEETAALIVWDF
jgi:WD40 repeat protein